MGLLDSIYRRFPADVTSPSKLTSTLMLPGDEWPLNDADEIESRLAHQLDALLDGGACGLEPTTVVDLAAMPPSVVRVGRGSVAPFGL